MLKVVDNVSPVIPCPSCDGHGGFGDQEGNSWECGDCNGSGQVNVDDLLAEVKRLRPVVEAAEAHANQTGSCLVCLMEYDGGQRVHRKDCPLAALEVKRAE